MDQHIETAKQLADLVSVGAIFAVLLGALPNLAALLTVLWLGARLWNEVMLAVYRHREHREYRRLTSSSSDD